MMFLHVKSAKYLDKHRIWLSFNDDSDGIVDLSMELDGEIFEPLKDITYFKSFKIEGHTLSWDNGADFAPEFLHELINKSIAENHDPQQVAAGLSGN